MPTLRFARDKRGYETTSLVHAVRHRGRVRQKILYWFRSPPNVKVGRPALDEEAIRWIEEHNPEIEFNWEKILEAQPPPPSALPEDGKNRRGRRGERREPGKSAQAPRRVPLQAQSQLQPQQSPRLDAAGAASEAVEHSPERGAGPEEALEQLLSPDVEDQPPPALAPVEAVVGHEQLARFRARFAELHARITERGGDPARIEALRAQAEALNPDGWVTEAEARQGLAEFEGRIRDLRNALGLRGRRRSHRRGRRRPQEGPEHQTGPQDSAAGPEEPTGPDTAGAPAEAGEPDEPDT